MNNKNNGTPVDSQGAIPAKQTIKEWLKNDLGRSISCLNAIYSDPDLLDAVAEFMIGRLENERNRQELPLKQKME